MSYNLSNKCAKNLWKRTVLVQRIIENVVTYFFEHSVYNLYMYIMYVLAKNTFFSASDFDAFSSTKVGMSA